MFLCPVHNFFWLRWLTVRVFGTWLYHHGEMCCVHLWSNYDLELWPYSQIYRDFDMFSCPAHNFLWIDIGLPFLANGCFTIRRCVAYIHDPYSMLTFDLKVKFYRVLSCLQVRPVTSNSFYIGIPYHIFHMSPSPLEDVSSTCMILIRPWTLTYRSN